MILKYTVDEKSSGKPVKYILKSKLELSERLVKKLKYNSKVLLNAHPVYVNAIVSTGDVVEVLVDFVEDCSDIVPENIHIDIIYEDDYLMALNKQPNIVVHPTGSHSSGTIANAVMYYLNAKGIFRKVRPVSRLDRDTTGIIIFAKNAYVQEALIRQMNDKTFKKEYLGIVHGNIPANTGTIELPIGRKPGSIMLRHISPDGDPAVTHFEVLECFSCATFLKFLLETGRTHQIRVHCQAIGHPLIGDTLYVPEDLYENTPQTKAETGCFPEHLAWPICRQALHSHRVKFIHPFTHSVLELTAPIPGDISSLLEILRK